MVCKSEYLKNTPDVLTLKDLQKVLQIGKNTALKLIHDGDITAHQITGGRWRILKEDVEEYLMYC